MGNTNIVGSFKFDPNISLSQEINYINMDPSAWSPTTQDFQKVAAVGGQATVCNSFLQMLGVIAQKPAKSVHRVNLFSHGSKNSIGFDGRVMPKPKAKYKRVEVDWKTGPDLKALDKQSLDRLTAGATFFVNGQQRDLKFVQGRFVKNGILFLYCCNSGVNTQFVQQIADTLRVTVVGFKPPIAYCPNTSQRPPAVDRNRVAIGSCKDGVATSFYHLVPDAKGKTVRRHPRP